jgi:hypothetical protein
MSTPSHHAYSVRDFERDGKKDSQWLKIGVAFAHKDGGGFDVVLDALPVNGCVTIREPRAKEEVAA